MRAIRIKLVALICLLCACGCSDEDNLQTSDSKDWTEHTIAIVLPMDNGLDAHWERTLGSYPELQSNWALLVATSSGWTNYRHQADVLASIFTKMNEKGCYRKLLMMVEACYSGGVLEECTGLPGMLFITATNGEETSKADTFNSELKVWMSNRFTSTFIEQISANPSIGMRDLYYRLFINTVGSHVMVYNSSNFGSLYTSDMSEFITFAR